VRHAQNMDGPQRGTRKAITGDGWFSERGWRALPSEGASHHGNKNVDAAIDECYAGVPVDGVRVSHAARHAHAEGTDTMSPMRFTHKRPQRALPPPPRRRAHRVPGFLPHRGEFLSLLGLFFSPNGPRGRSGSGGGGGCGVAGAR
jgi:hypothetical protein